MKNLKMAKPILLSMMILSWLTLPLLGRKAIKRFLPASVLMSILVALEMKFAKKRRWWWFYTKVHSKLSGGFPLTWGPFLVGSMWILRFTYGKFVWYILLNLIVDTFFSYKFVDILKSLGIGSLVRLKKYQLSLLFFIKSLLLYGFQMIQEKVGRSHNRNISSREEYD
ncbi:hypothetical protein [Neobacillus cucumis]|uniref:hypothetical protein n=1 Tax=Neobacillus cucumis TaxID=1740721 RepID=UPI0028533FC5|nr:hypothetical protein [Neobacillus cucumis]MDR4947900.1 hypothetical protein [Neobacillus cucumis]